MQEAVQNVVKYAEATEIIFKGEVKNDFLMIKIADNGLGFDIKSIKKSAGLTNMNSRMRTIGGEFKIS